LRYSGVWLGIGWLLVATIVYLSLATINVDVHVANGDKFGHITAYAVAAFWFMQLYKSGRSRFIIAIALALLGVGLEFAQDESGHRMFDYADMVADCIGIVLGWIAAPPRTPNLLERIERMV
jgi:VanZ family protein